MPEGCTLSVREVINELGRVSFYISAELVDATLRMAGEAE